MAKFRVWCRDCGEEMYNPSKYNLMAKYCKRCKLKAEIRFSPTPKVELKED